MSDELFEHTPSTADGTATVAVDPSTRADHAVPPELYGKFAEHLGWNIDHGIEAQLLFNPTFGAWPFPAGTADSPDGGQFRESDPDEIDAQIAEFARIQDYPASEPLRAAFHDAGAFWWMRRGDAATVTLSPDTGPHGDRAQRVEVDDPDAPAGLQQWLYLPLQRTATYELEVRARATEPTTVTVGLETTDADGDPAEEVASTEVDLSTDWATAVTTLEVGGADLDSTDSEPGDLDPGDLDPGDLDPDDLYLFSVTTDGPANLVLGRVRLYPDDHVNHADPDVVEFLRESDLPLLRWPGGNFVSGYDWRDGVGPVDERPTRPNPAWGGLESNLFGTAEFVAFCEAVGCEPTICVNAGDGTPGEAAQWVEYCNGDPEETELGALRAEHGHEEPFDITYWELGNELWGQWQVRWSTPAGNADRFRRFREAMLDVDPDIQVQACGSRIHWGGEWNDVLLEECGGTVRCITDHVLAGGPVSRDTDADELFEGFMGFADQLGREYRDLRERMRDAGVVDPRLAITELQLFPDYAGERDPERRLAAAWHYSRGMPPSMGVPTKKTISEALYDATIIHECIRMGDFVEMVTHSATVNHGGGLQKHKERVWADPCHYGHAMGIALAGKTPVAVDLACTTISTDRAFGQIDPVDGVPALDAMAVVDDDADEVVVMLVHRASRTGPVEVTLDVAGAVAGGEATRTDLGADSMAAENTLEAPEAVTPEPSTVAVEDGTVELTLSPYSLTRLRVPLESS